MEKIGINPSTTGKLLIPTSPVPNVGHHTNSYISLGMMATSRNSGVPYV
jgi:hypothetical protein